MNFDKLWYEVKDTYNTEFRRLVHSDLPDEKLIASEVKKVIEILTEL